MMGNTILPFRRGVLLGLLIHSLSAQAQLRNANWFFANNHVSFVNGPAVASAATQMPPYAPSTSLSDPSGNALAHAVGNIVLNAQLETMSGCPALNYPTGAQGYLFLPMPGDPDQLIVFHNQGISSPATITYGRIDMGLDNGLGGFVGGMAVLTDSGTCKLTAVAHANGQDYWILTQVYGTDAIAAYRLHAGGLDPVPVISHTGVPMTIMVDGNEMVQNEGILAASRTGDRLAMAGIIAMTFEIYTLEHARFEVLHFDNATGIATHAASIPLPPDRAVDGIEFSPDGTKLYFTSRPTPQTGYAFAIHQYDLSLWDEAFIIASHSEILYEESDNEVYNIHLSMALASDGRIWFSGWPGSLWLGAIDAPNEAGAVCTPIAEYLQLPYSAGARLPNQCKRYHDSDLSHTGIPATSRASALMAWPNPAHDLLYINAPDAGCRSQLFDATGRLVLSAAHGQRRTSIVDVAALPAGPYLVRCTDAQGNGWTSTVVKD